MKIKPFIFSLRGKALIMTTFFVVVFMSIGGYIIMFREKAIYLKDVENQVRTLVETAGINFTNTILYQEVGLIEEMGIIDHYIANLLKREKDILTVIIFDNNGIVIAHCHLVEHGKFYSNAMEIIKTQSTAIREVKDEARGPMLEAITPLMVGPRRLATLRIEFSLKNLYEKLAQLGKWFIFITISAISGSIFLIFLGINAVTKPLRKLAKDMDSIEYGRYTEGSYMEGKREDEIGYLQGSYSSMIRRLKEADIKWENTFNSITDLLSIHSRDYRIVKANNALAMRLNTTPESLVGRHCWEVYHDSHDFNGVCPDCPHASTLKTGKPSTCEREYSPLRGIFLSTVFPYFNEKGEITGTIQIAKDITLEKVFQEKFVHAEKMAAMGEMAAGIAHEINNPLNSILGYSTYLLENMDSEGPAKEELNRIATAASRCKEVVKKFLNFAREEPLHKIELVNLGELVEEVLFLSHHALSSHKIEVTKRIGSNPWLKADRKQMEEVLINIILNACDAMPGGGKLTITAYKEDSGITLKISDTGLGINPEHLPYIYDPFFTTKEPGKGTGLGLAVSYNIIKSYKGNIDVQSEVGKGTTFTIMIPERMDR